MATHTILRHTRDMRPPVMPASISALLMADTIVPLRRDLLPACTALMLAHKSRKHAGTMTQPVALKRLEACFDRERVVGAAMLSAWCQPVAFVLGRVELDSGGAPACIHLCELRVAAHIRRHGVGARLVEFLRQQCNDAPADFDPQSPRQQVLEWINLL